MKLKVSRPIVYVLLLGVVAYGVVLYTEEPTGRKPTRRTAISNAAANLPEGFTEEDLNAKFEQVNDSPRDAFKPLVARRAAGSDVSLSPDAIPSVLTGGDPNWVYTGMAEVDGIPTALVENKATGEGVFLKQAENWKQATVGAIAPFSLTLVGRNGKSFTMRIIDPEVVEPSASMAPVQPSLRGPIGNESVNVSPNPSAQRPRGQGTSQ